MTVPLPEPKKYFGIDTESDFSYFTAAQMIDYAATVSAADNAALREDAQRLIGRNARQHIISLVEQILEEGPETETTAMDMEYWEGVHDRVTEKLMARAALRETK